MLIFDGLGTAMLRSTSTVDPEFRGMLETLSSPHERNPEEEDYKQLTGILRSRRIRETFSGPTQQPTMIAREPVWGIFALYGDISKQPSAVLLLILNFLLAFAENIMGKN